MAKIHNWFISDGTMKTIKKEHDDSLLMTHVVNFVKKLLDIDFHAFSKIFYNKKFICILDQSITLWKSINWRYTYIYIF